MEGVHIMGHGLGSGCRQSNGEPGDVSPPVGSRGKAPEGSWRRSPQKLKQNVNQSINQSWILEWLKVFETLLCPLQTVWRQNVR